MGGYVYLICDYTRERTYKIGVTCGKIENRMKKLQTGNSGELVLIKYYQTETPYYLEKQLHQHFKTKNIMNEWFLLSDDDVKDFHKTCDRFESYKEILKNNPFFKAGKEKK